MDTSCVSPKHCRIAMQQPRMRLGLFREGREKNLEGYIDRRREKRNNEPAGDDLGDATLNAPVERTGSPTNAT